MQYLIEKLKSNKKVSVKELRELIMQRDQWTEDLHHLLAMRALHMGENFYAYDVAEFIPEDSPQMILSKYYIMGLALARSGSPERALKLLEQLPTAPDTQIIHLKAKIFRLMSYDCQDQQEKIQLLRQAAALSLKIFRQKKWYYYGINAASTLYLAGEKIRSQKLIRKKILPVCDRESSRGFQLEAVYAECYLLLEEFSAAALHYHEAAKLAFKHGYQGSLSAFLRQFHVLISNIAPHRTGEILRTMNLPSIAVFTGHMVDLPEQDKPVFPENAENNVRRQLTEIIQKHNIRISFSSCACGSDIIFMEEILKSGGECFIVPPLPMDTTIKRIVDIAPHGNWKQRLMQILSHENSFLFPSECEEIGEASDNIVYDFAQRFLLGIAYFRSLTLRFPLRGVAVWDGKADDTPGSTASTIKHWQKKHLPIDVIKPEVQ